MGSVRIFRKSGIGLDYYKGKDFMSRVVVLRKLFIEAIERVLFQKMYFKMVLVRKEHIIMHYYTLKVTLLLVVLFLHLLICLLLQILEVKMDMCM